MQWKYGPGGEILRKAQITYIITGGDPREFGYQFSVDHNENFCLISKSGRIIAIGEGISLGMISIRRVLGKPQQKDLNSGIPEVREEKNDNDKYIKKSEELSERHSKKLRRSNSSK